MISNDISRAIRVLTSIITITVVATSSLAIRPKREQQTSINDGVRNEKFFRGVTLSTINNDDLSETAECRNSIDCHRLKNVDNKTSSADVIGNRKRFSTDRLQDDYYRSAKDGGYSDDSYYHYYRTVGDNIINNNDNSNDSQPRTYDTKGDLSSVQYKIPGIRINDVTCNRNNRHDGGKFHMDITVLPGRTYYYNKPILESADMRAIVDPYCAVSEIQADNYQINFQDLRTSSCGVYQCASRTQPDLLCLTLRFPIILGARTSKDLMLKVQCNPQIEFVAHTKYFKLKPITKDENGRSLLSSPTYREISVGNSVEPRIEMALFKRNGKSGFTRVINEIQDYVLLGEEVQFRCVINTAHGWYYSRLGEVKIQRHPNSKKTGGYDYGIDNSDSIVVISADGCVNPRMQSVCPYGQKIDKNNPLIISLNMYAFAFDDMKDGDELLMSVTVYACAHYDDCYPTEFAICTNGNNRDNHDEDHYLYDRRVRRSSLGANTTDITSDISFRIRLPRRDESIAETEDYYLKNNAAAWNRIIWMSIAIVVVVTTLSVIIFIVMFNVCMTKKNRSPGFV